jgi:hypothetical protein
MSDYANDDPTGPASVAETAGALDAPGALDVNDAPDAPDALDPRDAPDAPEGGYGVPAGADTNWVDPDADANTDLMRPDADPLPDAQVPGVSPDGQAPTR